MTCIPAALNGFVDIAEDGTIRLLKGTTPPGAVLVIPEGKYASWKALFPSGLDKALESKYRTSRRLWFSMTDIPADAPEGSRIITPEGVSVFWSCFPTPIDAGDWLPNPPETLPEVSYADIMRLVGLPTSEPAGPAPEPPPAPAPEPEDPIPQALRSRKQWLCWRRDERDGKTTKIPVDPKKGGNTKAPEASWTYETCRDACSRRGDAWGIGISLRDGIIGVDFDHVLENGRLKPEYAHLGDIVDKIGSYTEISPSGEGLHIYCRCDDIPLDVMAGTKRRGNVEMYCKGRYFTVTGNAWKYPGVLRTISGDDCREIHTLLFGGANAPLPTRATTTGTTNSTPTSAAASVGGPKYVEDDEEPAVSDEEAINIIIKSTPKGRKLWAGDTSGYTSGSEADMALMCLLARATAYDEATYNPWQMVRLFLQSGLAKRDKSQKRPDYIKLTATNAIKYVYTKEREKGVETGGICKKEHTTRVEKKKTPEPEVICAGEISQNPQKMRMTMDDIISRIASNRHAWTCAEKEKEKKDQEAENPQNEVVKTQKEEKKQPPKYTIKLDRWYAAWHAYTRLAKSTDRRNGYYWFDGVEWHLDPEGEDILTAMLGVLTATGVQPVKGWNALVNIVALRGGTRAYPPTGHVEPAGIVCADGQILRITSTGVRSRMAAPEMEVWMSVLNVRGADIDPEISGMRLEEVWQKHPDWLRMMDACDEPTDTTHTHARLWATVAGYVLYAAHCIQGSGWPRLETMMWLMDDHIGNTGKTTHARQLFEAFGTLATHLNWGSVLTKPVYDGDLTDIVLGWADEAGDGELRDTGVFKSLLSGTGSFKVLYRDVKPQSRPLVMVCTANHPPRIAKKEMQDPIKRRIQTAVYTVHHLPQSSHGCSDEEAYRALIDCGIVVCRDIMFAVSQRVPIRKEEGSGVWPEWPDGTDDRLHVPGTPVLPYASSYEDTDRALDRVSWVDILTEAMAPRSGATIGLRQLRISLISWLRLAGRLGDDDTEIPRELRTDEAFKIRLQNWSLKIRTDDVDHPRDVWATITVREQTSTAREGIKGGGRYLVYGITLRSGTPYKLIDTKNEEDSENKPKPKRFLI